MSVRAHRRVMLWLFVGSFGCGEDGGGATASMTEATSGTDSMDAGTTSGSGADTGTSTSTAGETMGSGSSGGSTGAPQEPGWSVTLAGGIDADAGGETTMVDIDLQGKVATVTLTGGSAGTARLSVTYQATVSDPATGEKMLLSFDLVLDDGTECAQVSPDIEVVADIADGGVDGYDATFAGSIRCGTDDVAVTGYFRT